MPYVLLPNLATGQHVWVASFQLPADARGPAQRWRDEAERRRQPSPRGCTKPEPRSSSPAIRTTATTTPATPSRTARSTPPTAEQPDPDVHE